MIKDAKLGNSSQSLSRCNEVPQENVSEDTNEVWAKDSTPFPHAYIDKDMILRRQDGSRVFPEEQGFRAAQI